MYDNLTINQKFNKFYDDLENIREQIDINSALNKEIEFVDKYTDKTTNQVINELENLGFSDEDYKKMMEDFKW